MSLLSCLFSRSVVFSVAACLSLFAGGTTFACALPPVPQKEAFPFTLAYVGQTSFPQNFVFQSTLVGGLSGVTYDEKRQLFYAISDDRSEKSLARMYGFQVPLSEAGKNVSLGAPVMKEVISLKNKQGEGYVPQEVDGESLRMLPSGEFLWGSEGNVRPENYSAAGVRLIDKNGQEKMSFPLPSQILTHGYDDTKGLRYNLGFESLSLDANSPHLKAWTANEGALVQDGPPPSYTEETPVRLYELDLKKQAFARQYAYHLSPLPEAENLPQKGYRDNGLVDILSLTPQQGGGFLTLERAFIQGHGYILRLYHSSMAEATDVKSCFSLQKCEYTPLQKTLLFKLNAQLPDGHRVDNLEGMTWGPRLPDGRPTLVFVSDNNFSPEQEPQIVVFALTPRS